jgi:hypothetical protein
MHPNTDLAQRTLDRLLSTGQPVLDKPGVNPGHHLSLQRREFRQEVWCEWWCPEFGHCMGQIDRVTVKGYVVTSRSVLGNGLGVEIPVGWICGIYREQQAS